MLATPVSLPNGGFVLNFLKLLGGGGQQAEDGPPSLAMPSEPQPPPEIQGPLVRTPWETSLKLTAEQEQNLVNYAADRLNQLRMEVGLSVTNDVVPDSWMSIRMRHEQTYNGDLSWRVGLGSIFARSNLTLGSGIRHTRYISGRSQDDLLGTEPFFAALGARPDKEQLAKQLEEYVQSKVSETDVREALREAQKIAIIRNEAVVKTTYVLDSTPFIGPADVYCDQNGNPIQTQKGLFIFKGEQFEPDPMAPTQGMVRMAKDPSVSALPQQDGSLILMMPEGAVQAWPIHIDALEQQHITKDGVHCETLDYRAFLCSLRHSSIQDADTCIHLYGATPNALRARYGALSDVSASYFDWWDGPGDRKAKYEQGEQDSAGMRMTPEVLVAEQYMRFDPFGDNRDREIMLVWDVKSQRPIYYNYTANHYKRRPFDVIPGLEKVPNRWFGRGIFSLIEDQILYEDSMFNRLNLKDSKEGTITVGYREACVDWKNGISPVVGGKDIYWLESTWDAGQKPPVQRIRLLEDIEHGQELLTLVQQAQNGIVGSIQSKDASTSGMNQSDTKYGIESIQQEADVIMKATEQQHIKAIDEVLDLVVDLVVENMDPQVLQFVKGMDQLATLNADEARNLTRDVRLLLTRSKSTQLFQSADQSIAVFVAYRQMMLQDPIGARLARPLVIAKLKALECDDADDVCPEITDEMIQQWQAQQQQGQQQPPSKSISTKYTDLARSEQMQVLQGEGIQPAGPEEIAQQQATEMQTQMALKPPQPQRPPQ